MPRYAASDRGGGDATLKSVTVAGRAAEELGAPQAEWEDFDDPGVIYLTTAELADAVIVATPKVTGAKVAYARTTSINTEPEFGAAATFTLADGNVLWVEVKSQNGKTTLIYAITVRARGGLNALNLTRSGTTPRAATLGSSADSWNAVTDTGELLVGTGELAGKNPAGANLTIGLQAGVAPGTTVTYAIAKGTAAPNFESATPVTSVVGTEDGDWLYVRSVRTVAGDETSPLFYKIKLTEKDDNLTLTTLTLNTVSAGVTAADNLGWNSFEGAEIKDVELTTTPTAQAVTVVATAAESTTTVAYAVIAVDAEPPTTYEATAPATIPSGRILCLELTNELGEKGYYRVKLIYGSTAAVLTSVTIGGKTVTLADAAETFDTESGQFTGDTASIQFTIPEAGDGSTVTVVGVGSTYATVEYTWGVIYSDVPYASIASWKSNGSGLFAGGSVPVDTGFFGVMPINASPGVHGAVIFVRVTSESGTVSNVYAIRCSVDEPNDLGLTSVTIGGVAATLVEPGPVDTNQGFAYNGEYGSVELTIEQAGDGSNVKVVAVGVPGATITYSYGLFISGLPNAYLSSGYAGDDGPNTTGEGLFAGASLDLGLFQMSAPAGVDGAVIFIEVASATPGRTAVYAIRCSVQLPADVALTSVTVGGVAATLAAPTKLNAPGGDFNSSFTGAYGSVELTEAQAGDGSTVAVVATPAAGATVQYAWGVTANFAGVATYFSEWQAAGTGLFDGGDPNGLGFLTAEAGVDGAVILIEVTSSTGLKVVYAINCTIGDGPLPPEEFTVSFNTNGGSPSTITAVTVTEGQSMDSQFPTAPTKAGSVFDGWWDIAGNALDEYAAATLVTKAVTLTAKWVTEAKVDYETEGGATDYEVPLTGVKVKNTDPFGQADNKGMWVPITLPAGFDISKYNRIQAEVRTYLADGSRRVLAGAQGDWDTFRIGLTSSTVTTGVVTSIQGGAGTVVWNNYGPAINATTAAPLGSANAGTPLTTNPTAFGLITDTGRVGNTNDKSDQYWIQYAGLESLTFLLAPPAQAEQSFTLDLSQGPTVNNAVSPTTWAGRSYEDGVLKFTFNDAAAGQRGAIALTTEQITLLTNANYLRIEIDGEADPTNTQFRWHLGYPNATGSWNSTNTISTHPDVLANILSAEPGFSSNKSAQTLGHFILQRQNSTTATTVTIREIKITYW